MANPKIGWGFGWLSFCYLAIGAVAADSALASQAFMPLFGMAPNENVARVITLVALALQAILAIASTRVVAKINSVAVGLELLIVVVLAVALIVAVLITGTGSTDNLISQGIAAHAPQYFGVGGGLMLAMIMGLATLVGFDAAMRRSDRAVKVMARRTPWILRGMARLAPATGRSRTAPASPRSKVRS